ncbi:MAG: hypothetical protein JJ864_08735 [Rhizobiaceae bacterium]|nr:hypothetical protein [Rhizobiaceae bacterium]
MDRSELIERLERLDGPDREVDAALAIHFDEPHGYREDVHIESRSYTIIDEQAKRYTQSIDAAVALVEKVKPGWKNRFLKAGAGGTGSHGSQARDTKRPLQITCVNGNRTALPTAQSPFCSPCFVQKRRRGEMDSDTIFGLAVFFYFAFGLGVAVAITKDTDVEKDNAGGFLLLILLIGIFWPGVFGYWAAILVQRLTRNARPTPQEKDL